VVISASHFENLSLLFMTVGRSAPRYQMMSLLYPLSKNLQSSLSEYFLVVVQVCHQLLKISQKSVIGHLVSPVGGSDTKTFQSQLELWATTIKEEVNLLLAQKVEEEARENSRFRASSKKSSEAALLQKIIKMRIRLLDSCSTYDYMTTWKQVRKVGNSTLFAGTSQYQDWRRRSESGTLICRGKLGLGKSIMLANIVEDLHLYVQKNAVAVAYFFAGTTYQKV
jgi:hypothetical protein